MFAQRISRVGGGVFKAARRHNTGVVGDALMNNVWLKSTPLYLTYIFAGCVAVEIVYGQVTTRIWESMNRGVCYMIIFAINFLIFMTQKLFHHCDMTKFKNEGDDEDEE
jgi:hypothetical protein